MEALLAPLWDRTGELMWVVDHLDDLESDFSAIHHVPDMLALPGPKFFRLASRMVAYRGVMRARVQAEQDDQGGSSAPARPRSDVEHVPATRQDIESHPLLSGFIDIA